jgi:transcriptional regulator of acetoin/glycerol metabolism
LLLNFHFVYVNHDIKIAHLRKPPVPNISLWVAKGNFMSFYSILDSETLREEILASHERCKQYDIDPLNKRTHGQICLSPKMLAERIEQNLDFLKIATTQIQELYQFVTGAGFAVTISDKDGYILEMIGDKSTLRKIEDGNCKPGYRWTEIDVGTSAISLALVREIPVQINNDEHYCERGYEHTCSACPIYKNDNTLTGVIAMSGESHHVHPHTLGMVITAAKAIENQMRIEKTSKELLLRNNYMNAIIESIDSGVMAIDRNGVIAQVNNQGKQILQWEEDLEGRPLSSLLGAQVDLKNMMRVGFGYSDREVFIKGPHGAIHLIHTAKPIFESDGQVQGIIVVFNEIHRIRKLVNEMAGSQAQFTFDNILGVSAAIQEAKKVAMLAALGKSTVLLLGETGTGKELFAQAIHNHSDRRDNPFVAINCGAIPRELIESELFGYIGGAFTGAVKGGRPGKFELANSGTVLLDEIGDMPSDMQVKLLRVLQTGEVYRIGEHKPIAVDLRIIAATHNDLNQEVDKGNFREDLFYRLNVFPISIPPLRERPDDIILLARHILKRCARVLMKPGVEFVPESEQILARYHWPGNVRELENIIERTVNMVVGGVIEPAMLGPITAEARKVVLRERPGSLLMDVERQTIMEIIKTVEFNMSKAAKMLGITRATLYRKIKKYNLST